MLMPRHSSDLTAIDFYCGIGGTTSGFVRAGIRVELAANHDKVAIATHSANHPDVDHHLGDIQALDMRRLPPRARILCASPICTEVSPAGGKKKRSAQMDLWEAAGHVNTAAFERTRVTFWEVIRATELWRYDLVLIENVIEVAAWELFDVWLKGMETLGYEVQFCSVSAAHIGDDEHDRLNPRAPQWRDRLYMALRHKGVPPLDLEPRPLAWCHHCGRDVPAVQWWKPRKGQKAFVGRRIGKYGPQYLYVCPNPHPKTAAPYVEPYAAPVAGAIDWTNPGTRIGDREALGMRALGAATLARIEYGLRTIGDPAMVAAGGNTWDAASAATATGNGKTKVPENYMRAWPADLSPAMAQTSAQQNGIATSEPFVTMLRRNGGNHPVAGPVPTVAGARHHGLTIPPGAFVMKQYGGRLRNEHAVRPVDQPAHSTVAKSAPNLVIPYRKGAKPHGIDQPVSTQATKAQHGLLGTATDVEDCYFRMFTPRESANTQRFDPDYILTGSLGEQQLGAGNANPVNVAQWLGGKAMEALS